VAYPSSVLVSAFVIDGDRLAVNQIRQCLLRAVSIRLSEFRGIDRGQPALNWFSVYQDCSRIPVMHTDDIAGIFRSVNRSGKAQR